MVASSRRSSPSRFMLQEVFLGSQRGGNRPAGTSTIEVLVGADQTDSAPPARNSRAMLGTSSPPTYERGMELRPGDPAPDFELLDHKGQSLRLSSLRGRRVVLWFYPKADTPG